MAKRPVLSIGIIFKNEIRCLERCLKSLQPLRKAVPCELVMADTGSEDGSREIAQKYADVLFDFPWIDDFSAARNSVIDRAQGKWLMFIDCDEWIEDCAQLVTFFENADSHGLAAAAVTIRNHHQHGERSDAYLPRIIRMSCGIRYTGAIHESLSLSSDRHKMTVLTRTIFEHDGYMYLNAEAGEAKRKRNITALRKELAVNPDDLLRLLQFLESGQLEEDFNDMLQHAVRLVKEKAPHWERMGPPICRYAVMNAYEQKSPELEKLIALAQERFPNSFFTTVDVAYIAVDYYWDIRAFKKCLKWGDIYLNAVSDFRAGRGDQTVKLTSTVLQTAPRGEMNIRILMAAASVELGCFSDAMDMLRNVDCVALRAGDVKNMVLTFHRLHELSEQDTVGLFMQLWAVLNTPEPSKKSALERRDAFLRTAADVFTPAYLQKEQRDGAMRPAYTLYEPLAGQCEIGTAAAILAAASLPEITGLLGQIEDWAALPLLALEKALLSGVSFPLPDSPLNLEEMDALAAGLSQDQGVLCEILGRADLTGSLQSITWTRALALAAVQGFEWTGNAPDGVALARTFAKVEAAFLSRCYAPEILSEQNIHVLPPMHRFGWYCSQAFNALDAGDAAGYARLLRAGLETNPAMKAMVEYLTDYTPELQKTQPSGELLALAEQVRTLLAAYDPDDPAVAALKQSAAYQKVAYLIEETEDGHAEGNDLHAGI